MKTIIKVSTILACYISIINPAMSWGLKDLDPTNKNSALRRGAKQFDPTRSPHYKRLRNNVQKTAFYVNNKCPRKLNVALEFIPINSSSFKTNNYRIRPGEHAYLISSTNRIFYISARSPATGYSGQLNWHRKKLDVGNNKKYTYSLSCS